ncbi:MAG: ribose 5-phosphate isomerase B [Limnochordaceae bacterium]|nr:ribose 5-phosphate isomerase B [Limnochordaceae bacterium]
MRSSQRVYLVCTGNTCRSPMAAALLQQRLAAAASSAAPSSPAGSVSIEVRSAGLDAVEGAAASTLATEAMRSYGMDLRRHKAHRWSAQDAAQADLVLTMTMEQKRRLLEHFPDLAGRVFSVLEYAAGENLDPQLLRLHLLRQLRQAYERPVPTVTDRHGAATGEPSDLAAERLSLEQQLAAYDIPDPAFSGDLAVYQRTAAQLREAMQKVAARLLTADTGERGDTEKVMEKAEFSPSGEPGASGGTAEPAPASASGSTPAVRRLRVAVGCDHAGLPLKQEVLRFLAELPVEVTDFGVQTSEPVDYPDIGRAVATAVAQGQCERGILICGTGIGMAIAANKVRGVRAALCHDSYSARMAREHNDANVLTMGSRVIGPGLAQEIVRLFLTTGFAGGRHARRVSKLE